MSIFKDKVAIVTGAGSGIGRALSLELSLYGAKLAISDVRTERIERVAKEIEQSGGNVMARSTDVGDFESVKQMVADTVEFYGKLDYIFNIAGIAVAGEVRDTSIEDWHNVINVNLYGVINGVMAAYPIMVEQGFGHIVNMASLEGLVPFPGTASYVASKFGVVGLSHVLRLEGAKLGVKVSVVCPGHIKTAIFDDAKIVNIDRKTFMESLTSLPGITAEECAKEILRGVERNKATMAVTWFAKVLWFLHRLSPNLVLWIMQFFVKSLRDARIKS